MGIDGGRLLDLRVGVKVNSMLREESERGFRRSFEARGLLAQVFIRLAFDRRGAGVRVRRAVGSQDDFGPSGGNEGELLGGTIDEVSVLAQNRRVWRAKHARL